MYNFTLCSMPSQGWLYIVKHLDHSIYDEDWKKKLGYSAEINILLDRAGAIVNDSLIIQSLQSSAYF